MASIAVMSFGNIGRRPAPLEFSVDPDICCEYKTVTSSANKDLIAEQIS